MDNLTHSLVGAVLGQTGLKRKTGLAMPTLIIAANLPDIDAFAVLLGGHQHLAIRRGITHGPIAMLLLPVLLWAAMLAWDKWRPSEKRLPVHRGWLLALSFIGTLSHPALDWLNNYGVRLLEPFSSQWFYGDSIFIIDIWILAALISGLWWSLRLERRGAPDWRRPARTASIVILTYILANIAITTAAERMADDTLVARGAGKSRLVVANALPITFWRREILWRTGSRYGFGSYSLTNGLNLPLTSLPLTANSFEMQQLLLEDPNAAAFLFWSRMPIAEYRDGQLIVTDQRFNHPLARDRFIVRVPVAQ